jgi:hypothetical protein
MDFSNFSDADRDLIDLGLTQDSSQHGTIFYSYLKSNWDVEDVDYLMDDGQNEIERPNNSQATNSTQASSRPSSIMFRTVDMLQCSE